MRCPGSAEPLPGRLSPEAQFRLPGLCRCAHQSKLHGTRARSRLTGCAVRHTGNVCHQPWSAKPAGVTVNHHSRSSRSAVRHSPAPDQPASRQHAGCDRRATILSCGVSRQAANAASGKPGDLVRTMSKGGGAQDSQARRMHDAVHLSAAETQGITDAPLARHPHHRHAVSFWGPCRGDRSCAGVFNWRKVTISA